MKINATYTAPSCKSMDLALKQLICTSPLVSTEDFEIDDNEGNSIW